MNEVKANETENNNSDITIMIVDDHPLVRQALKNLIGTQPDMKVIAEAGNGIEAVKLAKLLTPRVIIMDIGMPVMNGLEATRQIKAQNPGIAILVLTVKIDKEHVIGILEAGAAGYLTKVSAGNDVIHAIRAILGGEAVLSPSILHEILKYVNKEPVKENISILYSHLNARELLLLKLAAKGMSNKIIASELHISESTVKFNLVELFTKLNASSRTEAVVIGLREGLISFTDLD